MSGGFRLSAYRQGRRTRPERQRRPIPPACSVSAVAVLSTPWTSTAGAPLRSAPSCGSWSRTPTAGSTSPWSRRSCPSGCSRAPSPAWPAPSAEEGSAAHEAVALALDGARVSGPGAGYARGAQAFLDHIGATVAGVEVPVFSEGRYGGFLDCVATTSTGKLVAIDWKTGAISPATAVQLLAYICAHRCLEVTGHAFYDWLSAMPEGTSVMQCPTDYEACWAVALTPQRWQATGFVVHSESPAPRFGPLPEAVPPRRSGGSDAGRQLLEPPHRPLRHPTDRALGHPTAPQTLQMPSLVVPGQPTGLAAQARDAVMRAGFARPPCRPTPAHHSLQSHLEPAAAGFVMSPRVSIPELLL